MTCYRVYGLTFRSDHELPGLDRVSDDTTPDYSVKFTNHPNNREARPSELCCAFYVSPWRLKCGQPAVKLFRTENRRKFLFPFYDGIVFILDRDRQQILINIPPDSSPQAAIYHLLFSLPGFLLGLRGSACLHGAAIGRGDSAIALLGGSRSGKSVLSAEMAARGVEILSDELVAIDEIDGAAKVYPGYRWISLRSDSLHCLSAGNDARLIDSEWHYLDESYVALKLCSMNSAHHPEPRKLESIYLLMPTDQPNCEPAIEQVPQHEALAELMRASGRTRIPYREFDRQMFSFLGGLMTSVPVFGLRYHFSAATVAPLTDFFVKLFELRPERRKEV